jgi:hypothetical protein
MITAMVSPSRSEIDISVCTPNYTTLSTSQFPNLLYDGWYSRQHHQQGSEYPSVSNTISGVYAKLRLLNAAALGSVVSN